MHGDPEQRTHCAITIPLVKTMCSERMPSKSGEDVRHTLGRDLVHSHTHMLLYITSQTHTLGRQNHRAIDRTYEKAHPERSS